MTRSRPHLSVDRSRTEEEISTNPSYQDGMRPHILFMIDQLSVLGGGERAMLRIVRELSRSDRVSVVTFRGAIHPEARELLAVPIVVLPLKRTYDAQALRAGLWLFHYIRRERVTVVHTFFETADLWGALVARLSGIRVIISSRRDMGILCGRKHILAYRILGPIYSRVLTVSNAVREMVIKRDSLAPNRVSTLYTGIQSVPQSDAFERELLRSQIGIPNQSKVVVMVANILPWKGHRDFLDAAALIRRSFKDVHFVIAGAESDPDLFSDLLRRRTELGLDGCVHYIGEIKSPNQLYCMSSVVCLLSKSEGLPNVVLEAMSAGCAVVATRVGGTSEIILDGCNGFLVESGDVAAAAKSVVELLQSPSLAQSIGERASQTIIEKFNFDQMMKKLRSIYDSSFAVI